MSDESRPPGDPAAPGPPPGIDPALAGAFRIDRDGVFQHEGQAVTHPGVLANLHANLRRGEDRGYYLAVGPFRVPVTVDDTPYVVTRLEPSPGGAGGAPPASLLLHLGDGAMETLDADTLWLDAAGVPRCLVKGGRFPARLTLAAWLQLASFLEEGEGGAPPVLRLGESRIRLRREPPPGDRPIRRPGGAPGAV